MERGSRERSSSAGSEKMERVGNGQKKNGSILFDRPKPTAGCSANGIRRSMWSILFDLGVVCCIIIRRSDALVANTEKAKSGVCFSRVIAC